MYQPREIAESRWDLRVVEIVIGEAEELKLRELEQPAAGVDVTVETAAAKVEGNYVSGGVVALDTIPQATVTAPPCCGLWLA